MKQIVVILDAGHGSDTDGKRSPIWGDGAQLMEWEFNRDIVRRIAEKLDNLPIPYLEFPYVILVPEDEDVSLSERCNRANQIYHESDKNAYLVSIHANAGGGTGWECFTSVGDTPADPIAQVFCKEAKKAFPEFRMRFDSVDGDWDKEAQFYILKNTDCPAILTENFFMDTESDCRYIMSEEGRDSIAQMHVEAIKQIKSI